MNNFAIGRPSAVTMGTGRVRISMLIVALLAVAFSAWIVVQQVFADPNLITVSVDFNVSDNSDSGIGVVQSALTGSEQQPPAKIIGGQFTVDARYGFVSVR